jgi:hypothetical protein
VVEALTPTLAPGDIPDLTDRLRHEGFRLSVGDDLRIAALVQRLGEAGQAVGSIAELAPYLAPVVCRSPEDQARLTHLVDGWGRAAPEGEDGDPVNQPATASQGQAPGPARKWSARVRLLALAALVAVAAGIVILFAVWPQSRGPSVGAQAQAAPPAAASGAQAHATASRIGRPAVAAVILGGLPLLAVGSWLIFRRDRRRALMRGRAGDDADRERLDLRLSDAGLFRREVIAADLGELRRHMLVPSDRLDVRATIARTIAKAGFFEPAMALRPVAPTYLLLVDRAGAEDHLGQFADLLARRFEAEHIAIIRLEYRGDPRRLVRRQAGRSEVVALETLRSLYQDHRLLVVADPGAFWDPGRQSWRTWVDDLLGFAFSAIVSPVPKGAWGEREQQLADKGFDLVAATPSGLSDLALRAREDRRPPAQARFEGRAGDLERRLATAPFRWTADIPPDPRDVDGLIGDLKSALGHEAFTHLCAVAVFPELHPPLTLAVGQALDAGGTGIADAEARFASLSRLPWLRHGRIPDWLRLALVRDLGARPDDDRRVRALWREALASSRGESHGLSLSMVRASGLTNLIGQLRAGRQDASFRETLLLDFLDNAPLPELAMGLDGRRLQPAPTSLAARWTTAGAVLGALVLSVGLAFAAPVLTHAGLGLVGAAPLQTLGLATSLCALLVWVGSAAAGGRLPAARPTAFALACAGAIALLAGALLQSDSLLGAVGALGVAAWCWLPPVRGRPPARPPLALFAGDRLWRTTAVVAGGAVLAAACISIGVQIDTRGATLAPLALFGVAGVAASGVCGFLGRRLGMGVRVCVMFGGAFAASACLGATLGRVIAEFAGVGADWPALEVMPIFDLAVAGSLLVVWRSARWKSWTAAATAMVGLLKMAMLAAGSAMIAKLDSSLVSVAFLLIVSCLVVPSGLLIAVPGANAMPLRHPMRGWLLAAAIWIVVFGCSWVLVVALTPPGGDGEPIVVVLLTSAPVALIWPLLRLLRPGLWSGAPAVDARAIAAGRPDRLILGAWLIPLAALSCAFHLGPDWVSPGLLLVPLGAALSRRHGWRTAQPLLMAGCLPLLMGLDLGQVASVLGGFQGSWGDVARSSGDTGLYLAVLLVARLADDRRLLAACRQADRLTATSLLVLMGPLLVGLTVILPLFDLSLTWSPIRLVHLILLLIGVSRAPIGRILAFGGLGGLILAPLWMLSDRTLGVSIAGWMINPLPLLAVPPVLTTAAAMLFLGRVMRALDSGSTLEFSLFSIKFGATTVSIGGGTNSLLLAAGSLAMAGDLAATGLRLSLTPTPQIVPLLDPDLLLALAPIVARSGRTNFYLTVALAAVGVIGISILFPVTVLKVYPVVRGSYIPSTVVAVLAAVGCGELALRWAPRGERPAAPPPWPFGRRGEPSSSAA